MHFVFVLPRFFPYKGGYENSMLAIARCLLERGHRATVFTTVADDLESLWLPGFKTFPSGDCDADGVRVRRFAISYNKPALWAQRVLGLAPYWRWKAQFWRPGFHVPGLLAALRETDADLIHVGPLPYNNLIYAGIKAAEQKCVPILATPCAHFGGETSSDVAKHYVSPHQIALLQHCDRVLCMTQYESRKLAELGVPGDKLKVIGHGYDAKLATGGDGEKIRRKYGITGPVVLHLGMKAYEKGSFTVLAAMKKHWERGSDAWLVMAGPSLRAFDEYVAPEAAGCSRLLNLPAFPDEEKRDLLAAADIVVQPSRVESLGLVLLEAWANAKPVVAADIAVSPELVESADGGAIVPFDNADALAGAIARLLGDGDLRREMGLRGQQLAQQYTGDKLWTRNAQEFEELATARQLLKLKAKS
jgi:glycosyltransferase involved in cell wall biosynthesis